MYSYAPHHTQKIAPIVTVGKVAKTDRKTLKVVTVHLEHITHPVLKKDTMIQQTTQVMEGAINLIVF